MVKPVSLSDPAFEALRDEKRDNESDSDVVLRLIREVERSRRDPYHFVEASKHRERALSFEEHRKLLERMDEADRDQAEARWGERIDREAADGPADEDEEDGEDAGGA